MKTKIKEREKLSQRGGPRTAARLRLQCGRLEAQKELQALPGQLNRALTGQTETTKALRIKLCTSMGRKHCHCSDHLGEIPCWRGQIEIQNESIYRSDNNSIRHELGNHIIALDGVCHLWTLHLYSGKTVGSVYVSRLINKSEKLIRPRAGLFRVVLSIFADKYLPWSAHPFQKLGGMD